MQKIKYVPVENSVAEWADKEALMKRWEGLSIYTLNRWLKEMREMKRFRCYILHPSHKIVFINLDGFQEFLEWKQKR
ncbi:TPA: DNA-binding protein [Streptococcus suis]|uniref:DNA-binding protein n=1 Tax=Streptococcus suis TaxID=1307 RepID=UPI0015543305|nr:DNA-binding protein [Streptococcus suis]NQP26509.1 DNA-binding protein [Streptococcus suis]NQP37545.1 DNA-binding protein [Streptococcus suis]WNO79492.1 DNA-binding protein [Streptococcus suis]HEL1757627.1 DNA-binding protein [Streptococcus suis]HEL1760221.1 DNA-binding protein [Streptococcus suis]